MLDDITFKVYNKVEIRKSWKEGEGERLVRFI